MVNGILIGLLCLLAIEIWLFLTEVEHNAVNFSHKNRLTPDQILQEIDNNLWMFEYYTVHYFSDHFSIIGHNKKPQNLRHYKALLEEERLCYDVCVTVGWL